MRFSLLKASVKYAKGVPVDVQVLKARTPQRLPLGCLGCLGLVVSGTAEHL